MNDLTITPKVTEDEVRAEAPSSVRVGTISEETITPSDYVNAGKMPYLLEVLEGKPAYNTFDVKNQSKEIDSFVISEMERLKMPDSKESYEKVLNDLLKHTKHVNTDIYSKMDQLVGWVRLQIKIQNILKDKHELETKDPSEMSLRQLEKFLKG